MDSQDQYYLSDDDSFTNPFSTPPGSNPFLTLPGSNPFAAPPGSPTSFHSAPESLSTEINPFEAAFTLANYALDSLDSLDLIPTPSSSGTNPLFSTFNPDATHLAISPGTFANSDSDPFSDPFRDPTTTSPPSSSSSSSTSSSDEDDEDDEDDDVWEWISSSEPSSPKGSHEWDEWDVRDVAPRESWPLRVLDLGMSAGASMSASMSMSMNARALCRRRVLEGEVVGGGGDVEAAGVTGVVRGKGVYDGFGVAEGSAASEKVGVKGGGYCHSESRVSVSGRGLPVVVETGAVGKSKSGAGCLGGKVKVE